MARGTIDDLVVTLVKLEDMEQGHQPAKSLYNYLSFSCCRLKLITFPISVAADGYLPSNIYARRRLISSTSG